jgi:predicted transcriptional regulator
MNAVMEMEQETTAQQLIAEAEAAVEVAQEEAKEAKEDAALWKSIASRATHDIRIQILALMRGKMPIASPKKLSDEIGASLNLVAYHVRVLEKQGWIELFDTAQRRGATEHFYVLTERGKRKP